MIIEPATNVIYLKIDEAKAGALDVSSRNTAVEFGEVIAVGEGVKNIKPKDKIFVKAWGIDIVNHEDKKYHFVNTETNAILAKVR